MMSKTVSLNCTCCFVWQRQFGFLKTDLMPENQGGRDRLSNLPKSSWTPESYQPKPQSSFPGVHSSAIPNARNTTSGSQWESSLFSSSLSDLFSRKRKLLVHLYDFLLFMLIFFISYLNLKSSMVKIKYCII